jgi:hypothetical protein
MDCQCFIGYFQSNRMFWTRCKRNSLPQFYQMLGGAFFMCQPGGTHSGL